MIQQNDVGQEQQHQLKKKSANELTASKEQFQQWRNDWVGLLATERLRVLQGKHKFPATNEEDERRQLEDGGRLRLQDTDQGGEDNSLKLVSLH